MARFDGSRSGGRRGVRSVITGAIFWCGVAVVCVIAVPAELLMGLISVIMRALDFIIRKVERE